MHKSEIEMINYMYLLRTMELRDRLESLQDQTQRASTEMEESKGPHSAKYHELRKREVMIAGRC